MRFRVARSPTGLDREFRRQAVAGMLAEAPLQSHASVCLGCKHGKQQGEYVTCGLDLAARCLPWSDKPRQWVRK